MAKVRTHPYSPREADPTSIDLLHVIADYTCPVTGHLLRRRHFVLERVWMNAYERGLGEP